MPQLSLYIDGPTLKKVRTTARKNHLSVSRWVRSRIQGGIANTWPEGFSKLSGSISDPSFQRPAKLPLRNDAVREKL